MVLRIVYQALKRKEGDQVRGIVDFWLNIVHWTLRFSFILSQNSTKMTEKGQKGMNADRKKISMGRETAIATLCVLNRRIEICSLELWVLA